VAVVGSLDAVRVSRKRLCSVKDPHSHLAAVGGVTATRLCQLWGTGKPTSPLSDAEAKDISLLACVGGGNFDGAGIVVA